MKLTPFDQLLQDAAALAGIEPGYWDIWGKHHVTPGETIQHILRAQGWQAETEDDLRRSLSDRMRAEWTRIAPPAVVVLDSEARKLLIQLPAEPPAPAVSFALRREDGTEASVELGIGALTRVAEAEIDGRRWIQWHAGFPFEAPLGYHEVETRCGDLRASTRYIVAPTRAYTNPALAGGKRAAGFAITLYGLRSNRNWGCGDFTDLITVSGWAARELGASFIALNPLHAIHNRRPFNTSPYLPNSIYYRNLLYLDVEAIEDFQECRTAQRLRRSPEVDAEIAALRETEFVEYERVHSLKLRFLKIAFARFLRERRRGSARVEQFETYCKGEGELLRTYATYCALDEYLHRTDPNLWVWTNWPVEFQEPNSAEVTEFARSHWRAVMFHQYAQWQISIQLERAQSAARDAGMPIGLYHDLALATDRFGSDLWSYRDFFITGARVGSPPDEFSPQGQDWAFPPPSAARHREDGYRLYSETIRKNCRPGGALRIDHVMRLFRLFWIPDGSDATGGAYVRELNEDLVRILALESVRNRVTVIGEDLGTVEPRIREVLSRMGILSYRLLMFEKDGDGGFRLPGEYPAQALVSTTTHDLATVAGFWTGADIEARRAAGTIDDESRRTQWESRVRDRQMLLDALFAAGMLGRGCSRDADHYPEVTGQLQEAIIGYLAQTPSELFAINQEDLTLEPNQQNVPGTTWQYPNWGRKARFLVEGLGASGVVAMARKCITGSGREG